MAYALAHRPDTSRADVYEEITDVVLADLEVGRVPWDQPWTSAGAPLGLPYNPMDGRTYAGVNFISLWRACAEHGFASQAWLTSDQIHRAGGSVRRGETGTCADAGCSSAGSELARAGESPIGGRPVGLPGRFSLFNVAQCDGISARLSADPALCAERDPEEEFHALFAATGIACEHGAIRTFYSLSRDAIILSDCRDRDIADYYRDWIHELLRATGHASRLGRELPMGFGSQVHGFEELVVEMGSALVCSSLGIEPALRHPDHVDTWVALLRSDCCAYSRATAAAEEAAAYLFALRDAQAAAFDRLEAEEAEAAREEAAIAAAARRRKRQVERERWASGLMTGWRPGESLLAARRGDLP